MPTSPVRGWDPYTVFSAESPIIGSAVCRARLHGRSMSCLYRNLPNLLEASMPPDPELVDLIKWAFLDDQIDGQSSDLAYTWLMANRPSSALNATHSATQ